MAEESSTNPPRVEADGESENVHERVRALRAKAEDLSATFERVERELKEAAGDSRVSATNKR
jgi:hypothetical protein